MTNGAQPGPGPGGRVVDRPRLTLFGTAGCHLCEEAAQRLVAVEAPAWRTVDVAGDEALLARYGTRIPVVRNEASGRELGWPFDALELRAWLESRGHAASSW